MTENKPEMKSERQKNLDSARKILKKLEDRISGERFREYESDNTFLKFVRVYSQHLAVVNQIESDMEIEDIEKRLSDIEENRRRGII